MWAGHSPWDASRKFLPLECCSALATVDDHTDTVYDIMAEAERENKAKLNSFLNDIVRVGSVQVRGSVGGFIVQAGLTFFCSGRGEMMRQGMSSAVIAGEYAYAATARALCMHAASEWVGRAGSLCKSSASWAHADGCTVSSSLCTQVTACLSGSACMFERARSRAMRLAMVGFATTHLNDEMARCVLMSNLRICLWRNRDSST